MKKLAAFVVALPFVLAPGAGQPASTATQTVVFATSGTWTVPNGVTEATFEVYGAQGGDSSFFGTTRTTGGLGGKAEATFPVTPGETFQIVVGGAGGEGGAGGSGSGGFNGGGTGGEGESGGAGGGGGSDVRRGLCAPTQTCGVAERVLVGGGGGGAGGTMECNDVNNVAGNGGAGGGESGSPGEPGGAAPCPYGEPGGGGTDSAGGNGGASGFQGASGSEGDFFEGGEGGNGFGDDGGGGGGGGYYGGGGGGAGIGSGGGGGGSGFVSTSLNATSSSLTSGVETGDGRVVITYEEPAQPPLDHYLCHRADSHPGFVTRTVRVSDQFGAHTVKGRFRPRRLCAPASKDESDVANAVAHLVWYVIPAAGSSTPVAKAVAITNEFGEDSMEVGSPIALLLPASKSTEAGVAPGEVPSDLDHYFCYAVTGSQFTGRTVSVADQFGSRQVTLAAPTVLCNPASKNEGEILNPEDHLVCYPLAPQAEAFRTVFTRDQFGVLRLTINRMLQLCVPSSKSILTEG